MPSTLRQAFILTVAAGAAAPFIGCEPTVHAPSNPPDIRCPDTMPAPGGSCSGATPSCSYHDDCAQPAEAECIDGAWRITGSLVDCSNDCPGDTPTQGAPCDVPTSVVCDYRNFDEFCEDGQEARCIAGTWSVTYYGGSCNPPPPTCPTEIPLAGTVCEPQLDTWGEYPDGCAWDTQTPCGPTVIWGGCVYESDGEVRWQTQIDQECTAQPEQCGGYDHDLGCDADPSCGWLAPSCDTSAPNQAEAGCYAATSCTVGGTECGTWGTCATVTHDPCFKSGGGGNECAACAAETTVCISDVAP